MSSPGKWERPKEYNIPVSRGSLRSKAVPLSSYINTWWLSDAIRHHGSFLTLVQPMASAWGHQAITWSNADFGWMRWCSIHLCAVPQKMLKIPITKTVFENCVSENTATSPTGKWGNMPWKSDLLLVPACKSQHPVSLSLHSASIKWSTQHMTRSDGTSSCHWPVHNDTTNTTWGPGGCFTNLSRALQDTLSKLVYCRNRTSYANFKLKFVRVSKAMLWAHVQSFSLKFSP